MKIFLGISNVFMALTILIFFCCCDQNNKVKENSSDKMATILQTNTLQSQDTESLGNNRVQHNNYFNIQENGEQENSPLIIDLPGFYEDLHKVYNSDSQDNHETLLKGWKNLVLKYKCIESFLYNNRDPQTSKEDEVDPKERYLDSIALIKEIQDSIYYLCGYFPHENIYQQELSPKSDPDEDSQAEETEVERREKDSTPTHGRYSSVVTPMSSSPKKAISSPALSLKRAIKGKSISIKESPERIAEILSSNTKNENDINNSKSMTSSAYKLSSPSHIMKKSNHFSDLPDFISKKESSKENRTILKSRVEEHDQDSDSGQGTFRIKVEQMDPMKSKIASSKESLMSKYEESNANQSRSQFSNNDFNKNSWIQNLNQANKRKKRLFDKKPMRVDEMYSDTEKKLFSDIECFNYRPEKIRLSPNLHF
ncbi:unnamed protein product [Moneuplotes crassus]|uniref:Uncharacterized protein n=1 Tax=Euplotes crassus TaxID=5936 RepID=A0AAD1UJW8_EUPCR|nr:unnamed protein product [Moneuplotes crassus]